MARISQIRALEPVVGIGPLFVNVPRPANRMVEQMVKAQISNLGREMSKILDSHCNEVRSIIRNASQVLGIPETEIRTYIHSTKFLNSVYGRDQNEIPVEEKMEILSRTRYDCPALGYLTRANSKVDKCPLDFTSEELTQTFRNQTIASKNYIRAFAAKYSR